MALALPGCVQNEAPDSPSQALHIPGVFSIMKRISWRLAILAAIFAAVSASSSQAITISGGALYADANEQILLTFDHSDAAHYDLMLLSSPVEMTTFNNRTSVSGQSMNLGSFNAGTELVFRLDVTEKSGQSYSWFSGNSGRNTDNTDHIQFTQIGANTWRIGWEDLSLFDSGYDGDYNDLIVTITGVQCPVVPEPATVALVGIGAGLIGAFSRRRRRSLI